MWGQSTYIRNEPPGYVVKRLLESEELIFATRKHGIKIFPYVAICLGTLVLTTAVTILLPTNLRFFSYIFWYVAVPLSIIYMLVKLWLWATVWYIATNKRILHVRVLFFSQDYTLPISKVTDLTFKVSFWGEIFGYGKFIFESAGQDQAINDLNFVPQSYRLYYELCAALFGDEKKYRNQQLDRSRIRRAIDDLRSFFLLAPFGKTDQHQDESFEDQPQAPAHPTAELPGNDVPPPQYQSRRPNLKDFPRQPQPASPTPTPPPTFAEADHHSAEYDWEDQDQDWAEDDHYWSEEAWESEQYDFDDGAAQVWVTDPEPETPLYQTNPGIIDAEIIEVAEKTQYNADADTAGVPKVRGVPVSERPKPKFSSDYLPVESQYDSFVHDPDSPKP